MRISSGGLDLAERSPAGRAVIVDQRTDGILAGDFRERLLGDAASLKSQAISVPGKLASSAERARPTTSNPSCASRSLVARRCLACASYQCYPTFHHLNSCTIPIPD